MSLQIPPDVSARQAYFSSANPLFYFSKPPNQATLFACKELFAERDGGSICGETPILKRLEDNEKMAGWGVMGEKQSMISQW